jgi:hypothetical protein
MCGFDKLTHTSVSAIKTNITAMDNNAVMHQIEYAIGGDFADNFGFFNQDIQASKAANGFRPASPNTSCSRGIQSGKDSIPYSHLFLPQSDALISEKPAQSKLDHKCVVEYEKMEKRKKQKEATQKCRKKVKLRQVYLEQRVQILSRVLLQARSGMGPQMLERNKKLESDLALEYSQYN